MRSFIAVATGVLLLVCASIAAPSVKLPKGFTAPANVKFTGDMLYYSIAHNQKTLPTSVDLSTLAVDSAAGETLLGSSAKRPATLVIIPEAFAPKDVSGELADNAFPLMEMSMTLSTAVVLPGISDEMKDAFYFENVRKIDAKRGVSIENLNSDLSACGISVEDHPLDHSFTMFGADFDYNGMLAVLAPAALACSSSFDSQITVVDLRAAYNYAKSTYGSTSAQVEAVQKMIDSVLSFLAEHTTSFVLATNDRFYANQLLPDYDFVVVPPRITAALSKSATEMKSSPNTGIFQITLWFTIFIFIVIVIFSILTCGVGVDIEKDTLLYQTTALRGQPVL